MGGLVVEQIRHGVIFIPDAAKAFMRAEAQVRKEFGRNIDVNSTYRSWDDQMKMFINWNLYVSGKGPYPGHSKAVHPSESFHVAGTALDSDDWTNARIVEILAENGFIRNRLHIPNEKHHFEWIRSRDKNYGKPLNGAPVVVPKPEPLPIPTLEELMAFNNITIAMQLKQNVDAYNSTSLDFEDGMKTGLYQTNWKYTQTFGDILTEKTVIVTESHYNGLIRDFDAHMEQRREHELAIARAQSGR